MIKLCYDDGQVAKVMRPLMSYQLGPKAMMANLIRQVARVVCPLIGRRRVIETK